MVRAGPVKVPARGVPAELGFLITRPGNPLSRRSQVGLASERRYQCLNGGRFMRPTIDARPRGLPGIFGIWVRMRINEPWNDGLACKVQDGGVRPDELLDSRATANHHEFSGRNGEGLRTRTVRVNRQDIGTPHNQI